MQMSRQEQKSEVEAGNRGNRKELAEHDMEAFVLRSGEEEELFMVHEDQPVIITCCL